MPGTSPQDQSDRSTPPTAGGPATAVRPPAPGRGAPAASGRLRVLGWSLGWLGVALGVGAVLGFAVGALNLAMTGQSDGWEGLVAVVLGMLAGIAAATIVWIVAMTLATRRFVPAGRRLEVLGWSAAAVVGSPVLVVGVLTLAGSSGGRASVLISALLALLIAPPLLVVARTPRAPGAA